MYAEYLNSMNMNRTETTEVKKSINTDCLKDQRETVEHFPQEIKEKWEREQMRLKRQMIVEDSKDITSMISLCNHNTTTGNFFIGGVDISFVKGDNENACAALVVVNFPQLDVVYEDCQMIKLTAPYIPGFLAFREAYFLVDMYKKLKTSHPQFIPQVIMVDGNGLLHPREFGLACHLGVLLDTPCIGVAKKLFQVDGLEKNADHHLEIGKLQNGGDTFPLVGASGKILGKALRSCDSTSNPIYISTGHRITLDSAVDLVHRCCNHRVPEPTRQADVKSREYLRVNFQSGNEEELRKKQKTKTKLNDSKIKVTVNETKSVENVEELFESTFSLFDEDDT